jgi:hypothetical protein
MLEAGCVVSRQAALHCQQELTFDTESQIIKDKIESLVCFAKFFDAARDGWVKSSSCLATSSMILVWRFPKT